MKLLTIDFETNCLGQIMYIILLTYYFDIPQVTMISLIQSLQGNNGQTDGDICMITMDCH